MERIRLTEAKTDELNKKRGMASPNDTTIRALKAEGKETVSCQCGTTEEEDEDMVSLFVLISQFSV